MFNETFYVCREFAVALEVPEGDAAELIVIVPVVEELLDAANACLVLGFLRIREFEGRYAANLERLDVGVVAAAGDGVGLAGDAQLLGLVVELLVLRLLAQLALDDVAVRLGHLALPLTLAPVEQRHGDAHRDHLVAQQVAVGAVHVVARAGVAQLGVEVDALAVGAGRGHGVVGLHLA